MNSFDLFLVAQGDPLPAAPALLAALESAPHLRPVAGDPTRFTYHDPETTVHFSVLVSPALLEAASPPREEEDEDEEGGWHPGVLPGRAEIEALEARAEDEDDEGDEEAEDTAGDDLEEIGARDREGEAGAPDTEGDAAADFPEVSVAVPLFRPTFFLEEALALLAALQEAAPLALLDPQADDEGPVADADRLLESWRQAHLAALGRLRDPEALCRWSPERSGRFFAYASRRQELERTFGLHAPRLHPALHQGAVKSLCVWRCDTPVVLPRCDLVLLQRPQERRGLLGRRNVLDERVVPASEIWRLLGPFAEVRNEPAAVLIYRQAPQHPAQVARALEGFEGEPVAAARRCELAGVVDIELPGLAEAVSA